MSAFCYFSAFAHFYFSTVALKLYLQKSSIVFTGETGNDKESPKVQSKLNHCLNANHGKKTSGQIFKYNALFLITNQGQGMKNYQSKEYFVGHFLLSVHRSIICCRRVHCTAVPPRFPVSKVSWT